MSYNRKLSQKIAHLVTKIKHSIKYLKFGKNNHDAKKVS